MPIAAIIDDILEEFLKEINFVKTNKPKQKTKKQDIFMVLVVHQETS